MNQLKETTKSEFEAAKGRLLRVFDATPDDRLNWSPSETARTPVQLVAHCANSIAWLHSSFAGESMPKISPAEFDATHLAREKKFDSRDQVGAHLEASSAAFLAWLWEASDQKLAEIWQSPFGDIAMTTAIIFPAKHTDGHTSQLEYAQTIYGDRIWH